MRFWRNWQTRTVQVRVGNHGGSNPLNRTIRKQPLQGGCFLMVKKEGIRTHTEFEV